MTLPYAEDLPFWKSGQSAPDVWMDKTKKLIFDMGGKVLMDAYGNESGSGRAAFMMMFEIKGDKFKLVWPVLPTRSGSEKAARIQAATMMYHDVKAKCVNACVFGARAAFFTWLMLPDGRTAGEASVAELSVGVPAMFGVRQLVGGQE